ncbi:hemolysin III family protein [Ruminococcaceae bacterium OttesenSCG-928-O06]|nr:hemolysin III family protein [Ruminococcaceae bacterium OttesenSCG-928-O06]
MDNTAPAKDKTRKTRPLKQYTKGEEIFNSVSHGVGALLAVIGGSVAVTLAAVYGGARQVTACAIYAASLFILYTMSTLYHAFPFPRVKYVFRIFDHSSVFLLIAGTYTPFTLITLEGKRSGLIIFLVVWAAAIIGIALNAISVNRFAKLSLVLYIVMGWSVVFAIGDIVAALPAGGVLLLFLGGVGYTAGIVFYVIKKVRYFHSIWHLFVMAGSILHYFCIVLYVLPKGT